MNCLVARNPVVRLLQIMALLAMIPSIVPLLIRCGSSVFHRRYTPIDMQVVGAFDLDQENGVLTDIPESVRRLDGKRVRIHGTMWCAGAGPQVSDFQIVQHFPTDEHQPPLVQRFVRANMLSNASVPYYEAVWVEGVFHVRVAREEGRIASIFRITPESVGPATAPPLEIWPFIIIGFMVPMLLLLRFADIVLLNRPVKSGHCRNCGYDLRATPDCCPECGTAAGGYIHPALWKRG